MVARGRRENHVHYDISKLSTIRCIKLSIRHPTLFGTKDESGQLVWRRSPQWWNCPAKRSRTITDNVRCKRHWLAATTVRFALTALLPTPAIHCNAKVTPCLLPHFYWKTAALRASKPWGARIPENTTSRRKRGQLLANIRMHGSRNTRMDQTEPHRRREEDNSAAATQTHTKTKKK